jgi:SAM-dependent methyltransferase
VTEARPDRPATADPTAWAARRTAFGSAADAYAFGRPSYPREAVEWALPDGARRVLDLAAGTGRLTARLLELGLDVIAVEPLAEMRAHVPSPAAALDGTAEALPLDDASVDAVVVGQAFHWFDVAKAMTEIRRVLKVGGTLGLLWNMLDDGVAWVDELCRVIEAEERFSNLAADQRPPYDAAGMSAPVRELFRHGETFDVDRLQAYVVSRSQTILGAPENRERMLRGVRDLAPTGTFELPMVCEAWRGERIA